MKKALISKSNARLHKLLFCQILGTAIGLGHSVEQSDAQQDLPSIPANAVFVTHLRHPERLVEELFYFRQLATRDKQLEKIVSGKPFPLGGDTWIQDLENYADELIEKLEQVQSATWIVTSLEPAPKYAFVIRFKEAEQVGALPDIGRFIKALFDALPTKNRTKKVSGNSTEALRDYRLLFSDFLNDDMPRELHKKGDTLYLSNDRELLDWLVTNQDNKAKNRVKTLAKNRRFNRAMAALGKTEDNDILIYAIPSVVLPIWDKKYDSEYLEKFGFGEMVGAAASLDLGVTNIDGTRQVVIRMSVPHTEPVSGVVAMWKMYRPIEAIPRVADYVGRLEEKLTRLRVSSLDRREVFKVKEEVYKANGELEKLRETYRTAIGRRDFSIDVHRDYTDGMTFQLWTTAIPSANRNYSLIFQRTNSPGVTREWVEKSVHSGNTSGAKPDPNPRVHMKLEGYDGWFLKDRHARNQFELDYDKTADNSKRHSMRNAGMVIADKWLMFGEKWMIEEYFSDEPISVVDLGDEFEKVFPGAKEFVENFRPALIDIQFPGCRARSFVESFRVAALGQRGRRVSTHRRARRLNAEKPLIDELKIESSSDRLVALCEWYLRHVLETYSRYLRGFACRDDSFAWEWRFYRDDIE